MRQKFDQPHEHAVLQPEMYVQLIILKMTLETIGNDALDKCHSLSNNEKMSYEDPLLQFQIQPLAKTKPSQQTIATITSLLQ